MKARVPPRRVVSDPSPLFPQGASSLSRVRASSQGDSVLWSSRACALRTHRATKPLGVLLNGCKPRFPPRETLPAAPQLSAVTRAPRQGARKRFSEAHGKQGLVGCCRCWRKSTIFVPGRPAGTGNVTETRGVLVSSSISSHLARRPEEGLKKRFIWQSHAGRSDRYTYRSWEQRESGSPHRGLLASGKPGNVHTRHTETKRNHALDTAQLLNGRAGVRTQAAGLGSRRFTPTAHGPPAARMSSETRTESRPEKGKKRPEHA